MTERARVRLSRTARIGLAVVGSLIILGAALVLLRFLLDQPDDHRVRYMQVAAVFFPALTLVAAIASAGAALASWRSARTSADTARRAQEALAIHYRPKGWWRTWSQYDLPEPGGGFGAEDPSVLGDRVMAEFAFNEHLVENIQFWYKSDDSPVSHVQGSIEHSVYLPGVAANPKPPDLEPARAMSRAPTNIRWWRAEVYQPDGQALWRAEGAIRDPRRIWRLDMNFQIVRGPDGRIQQHH